jgi:probable F420-dependent oxidoreductase
VGLRGGADLYRCVVTRPIRFGVQAGILTDQRDFLDLARKAEASGFDALYVSDHPGVSASPFVCLAAAASVTSTLKLGTYVCNAGVRDPLQLACDAATIDVASNGRFILGLGAGHTPAEWTMGGRPYPSARARIARLGEIIEVLSRLFSGEVVTFRGSYVQTADAFLLSPRPVQDHLPVLVGGNGKRLLRAAARYADIISLTGLGRTLDDGHRHTADWSAGSIRERVDLIRQNASDPSGVVLDALVQEVKITNDKTAVSEGIAAIAPGLTPGDVLAAPYALIGTTEEIEAELLGHRERWGFSSYVVREAVIDAITPVVARLSH